MKKSVSLFTAFLIGIATLFAQAPDAFKYQAVARDASGEVIANQQVNITITILQGSIDGTSVYTETHDSTTNEFGLVNLTIGAGDPTGFAAIDWNNGPYFVKVEMDGSLMGISQLLSVPYAKYADNAGNTFSGNYSDLTGTPNNVSIFTNDAGYLTGYTETDPIFGAHAANGITTTNINNWISAYGWGNHSTIGYTTTDTTLNETEVDNFVANNGYLTSETDPVFGTSIASDITATDTTNWNTAFNWGDHTTVGYDPTKDSWTGDNLTYTMGNIGIKTPPSQINLQIGKLYSNFFDHSFQDIDTSMDRTLLIGGLWDSHSHSKSVIYLAGNWVNPNSITGSITFCSGAWENAAIQGREGTNTDWSGELVFLTRNNEDPMTERIRITEDGNVGIGTNNPSTELDVNGNVHVAGDLTVDGAIEVGGTITGSINIDTIHVSQITGLLGGGYSLMFPDILDNLGILEVNGIGSNNVVVLNGPGYDVEAIENYNEWGERDDLPGRSMEHPIIFEADSTDLTWLTNMKSWFDEPDPAPKDMAVIIPDVGGNESIRWNCTSFTPDGYEAGVDNRIRFTLINDNLPDTILQIILQEPDPFGSECSMNLENDPDEILFDGQKFGCPSLEVDTAQQVMTLTWDFKEANGVWAFIDEYFQGYDGYKFQVVASWMIPGYGVKQSTFDGCFPLHFEHLTGFGLDQKTKLQMKVWYVRMREA